MNKEINRVKEILGKYKYVYRIYKKENEFHIEKYPIVYSNSEIVYYKTGRKNTLDSIAVNYGWESSLKLGFYNAINYLNAQQNGWYYPISVYFIETDKIKEHDLSLIKQELKKQSNKSKIEKQEEIVERAKKSYEAAVNKLNNLKGINNENMCDGS